MRYAIHNKFYAADDGAGSGGGATGTEAELDEILSGRLGSSESGANQSAGNAEGEGAGQQKPGAEGDAKSETKEGEGADKQGSEAKTEDVEKDVESKLFGSGKPEEETKKLKRLYDASSKEGVRLSKHVSKLNDLLDKQGIEVLIENGEPVGFVARKGAKGQAEPGISLKDLPDDVKEAFDNDPEKAVKWVWAKAKSAFARVAANEDVVAPISDERKAAAIEALAEEAELDGEKSYPDAAKAAEQAIKFISATGAPRELKNLYYKSPELAIKLIYAFIDNRKCAAEALVQRETAKKTKAKAHPDMGASKTGVASATAKDWESEQGKAIAGAQF